mmetsp:Transcript_42418/g.137628  ORF Transcript_42418/g.137628 Transcript_42418/m.137628 type:complete len:208 (-) Transcript_42418:640-1263(-)
MRAQHAQGPQRAGPVAATGRAGVGGRSGGCCRQRGRRPAADSRTERRPRHVARPRRLAHGQAAAARARADRRGGGAALRVARRRAPRAAFAPDHAAKRFRPASVQGDPALGVRARSAARDAAGHRRGALPLLAGDGRLRPPLPEPRLAAGVRRGDVPVRQAVRQPRAVNAGGAAGGALPDRDEGMGRQGDAQHLAGRARHRVRRGGD